MEVINAVWEKKNLGVNVLEVRDLCGSELEQDLEVLEEMIRNYNAQYVVVKADSSNSDIILKLQLRGFLFMESQIEWKFKLKKNREKIEKLVNLVPDGEIKRICNPEELIIVQNEIHKGIFDTDRIALDPYFGLEKANARYANWVEMEYNRGSDIYMLYDTGKPIGFTIMKNEKNGNRRGVLGGLFKDFKLDGYPMYLIALPLINEYKRNTKKITASISSNNLEMLKVEQFFGYEISTISNIFIKHIEANK